MVKHLRFCWKVALRGMLLCALLLLALGFWLQGGERSLAFAKPWILAAVNSPAAPYTVSIGHVSIDWSKSSMLGKMRLSNVTLARRDGGAFAQLPEVLATLDPFGFLPSRSLLHKVILQQPSLYLARTAQGVLELGIQDVPERLPAQEMIAFFAGNVPENGQSGGKPASLPFHDFIIREATLTFTDEASDSRIVSTPFNFHMRRRHGSFEALMAMPFTVDKVPVKVSAALRMAAGGKGHRLEMKLAGMPSHLLCLLGACGNAVAVEGPVDGDIALDLAEDFSVHGFQAALATSKLRLNAPEWFAEPLALGTSSLAVEGDWSQQRFTLTQVQLQLEDTSIRAAAKIHKAADGWYATLEGGTGKIDVTKLYKYWPLTMAPDSRRWVTGKMKSGYAEKSALKLNLTPAEFAADTFSDAAVTAMADARDITFEYLPGFPLVEHMDGIAHFTGTTVKVESGTGSLLEGTKISKALLWIPNLNDPHIPMEATVTLSAPAKDAARMLALPHFTFDDVLGLDPQTISGTVDATMALKFNAFSNAPEADPNAIHLEAVDYDIAAKLRDMAQAGVYGSYDVRALDGTLTATAAGFEVAGSLGVGDSGVSDMTLSQKTGGALYLAVKGQEAAAGKTALSTNDFSLVYQSGAVPAVTLRGRRLDASVSYGKSEHGLLRDFPAIKLDINLGELRLSTSESLRNVVGTLSCTAVRCQSANIKARSNTSQLRGTIGYKNGVRQFLLTANDAGSMLKALAITDRMRKGQFEMRGTFDDKKTPPQLNARLVITDFTLKNSQILGRILSIGSLTGLSNALTGNGIAFEKLSANIASRAGIITVDKGVANGAAIGITVGGTIDTNSTRLALKGVVVPAYALNSILGKIPIIGLIAGGEGEGLIAFNYSVKGTYSEPDVGVNPLSGLTPGFLRGIFGIFDEDTPSEGAGDAAPEGVQPD